MLPDCIKVTRKNNLMNKCYSILIYNIQKQNKSTSEQQVFSKFKTLNRKSKIWTECGGTSSRDLAYGSRHFSSCDFVVFRRPPSAVANAHGRGPREYLSNSWTLTSSFLTSRINSIHAKMSLSAVTVTFLLST